MSDSSMVFRNPTARDGAAMWRLVGDAGTLEANTPYAYLLLCSHFAATSIVVEDEAGLAGFVASYRPPSHPEAVFVWQVGVHPERRGRGLGNRMLHAVVGLPACRDVTFLEATVTPSNEASAALFRSLARDFDVPCAEGGGYPADLFPGTGHEPEILFRIGPLPPREAGP